ncbi:hypothetical protein [Nocardioides sp. CFH 31398]|uniref:hypothetical protein n=1 Tax=Nocardioides sp. CFH 31398 TaxID=2919579 RepID=UPI001F068265|nr:hypothetical protein [Nocardioides sp. CFH 31398]MCH1865073.1 hypothetical protein [Nocardioides sp. CFH 31398]
MSDTRVLREEDPEAARLLGEGWTVVAESWGARLRDPDPQRLRALVDVATLAGYDVRELERHELGAVAGLEAVTAGDYPRTPATDVPARTRAVLEAMDARFVGAWAGDVLAAVTAVEPGEGLVETSFTSVHPEHRRRGLAAAVKAASVLVMLPGGARVFGTGGAAVNAGSLAMNARVGYLVEERWLSLRAPAARPADDAAGGSTGLAKAPRRGPSDF